MECHVIIEHTHNAGLRDLCVAPLGLTDFIPQCTQGRPTLRVGARLGFHRIAPLGLRT